MTDRVFHGLWVNYSEGSILGCTLTLSSRDGSFLVAGLALYVTIAGGQLWSFLKFVLHQLRAKDFAYDALHHQQQAILRNNSSAIQSVIELVRIGFAWRKLRTRPYRRTLPLALLAFGTFLFFSAAGVYSSEATKASGNQFILHSPNCGSTYFNASDAASTLATQQSLLNESVSSAAYSHSCYGQSTNPITCSSFASQEILIQNEDRNASCPFGSGLCIWTNTSAYQLDTGYIDSNSILGFNAPQKDRILFRKMSTCSVVHTGGFSRVIQNNPRTFPGVETDDIQLMEYGPRNGYPYTYFYNLHTPYDQIGYQLMSIQAIAGLSSSYGLDWMPVTGLNRTDADVSLFFLSSNDIVYTGPVEDPWFPTGANVTVTTNFGNQTYYTGAYYITVLGCIDQYQICGATEVNETGVPSICTPLGGVLELESVEDLSLNTNQINTANIINLYASGMSTYSAVSPRGLSALAAAGGVFDGTSPSLPTDQWTIEVKNWFNVGLAYLQRSVVEFATGPGQLVTGQQFQPAPANWTSICNSIKVGPRSGHQNFSVLGVAVIVIFGGWIIFLGLAAEPLSFFVLGLMKRGAYRRIQWAIDGKLQLQRMAYESSGWGIWMDGAEKVPLIMGNAKLGQIDIANPEHPILFIPREHENLKWLSQFNPNRPSESSEMVV